MNDHKIDICFSSESIIDVREPIVVVLMRII